MSSEPPKLNPASEANAVATDPFEFTVDSAAPSAIDTPKSSYSLVLLFYITTVAAILAAICRLAFVGTELKAGVLFGGYLVVGILSVVMAMLLGYFIGRTWVSTLLGLLAGSICGLIALLMILVQPTHFESAGMLLCAGCWILSMLSIAGNRWQKS